jgi:hypothetical protein
MNQPWGYSNHKSVLLEPLCHVHHKMMHTWNHSILSIYCNWLLIWQKGAKHCLVVVKCVSLYWKNWTMTATCLIYICIEFHICKRKVGGCLHLPLHKLAYPILFSPTHSTLSDDKAPLTRRLMVLDIVLHGVHYGMLGAWYLWVRKWWHGNMHPLHADCVSHAICSLALQMINVIQMQMGVWPWRVCYGHNILEPVLERPSKKESKTTVDSKNLVEPLELR